MAEIKQRTRQTIRQGASRARFWKKTEVSSQGFTLIELIIVMAIIAILVSIAVPIYANMVRRAKEAVLREDLHTMRTAIDSYTVDKEQAPQSLDDLVQAGYLKSIPVDPMTDSSDTWVTSESDTMTDINETQGGMDDVHSGSEDLASDGTSYNTW
jgi:general secretion pathway protein G